MSAADRSPKLDLKEAYDLGIAAVKLAVKGTSGKMVSLVRGKGKKPIFTIGAANLSSVAVVAKPMPSKFITRDGFFVTKAFFDYGLPLIGPLPEYVRLKGGIGKEKVRR